MTPTIASKDQIALSSRVMTGRAFYIRTPSCTRFYARLERWLTSGMLGAVIYGRPRLGKTSAARWTLSILKETIGTVPWIEVPCRKQQLDSERAFFQHILHCAKNKYYKTGTTPDRRDRLAHALRMRAVRSPIKTVIMFFDEAQHMSEIHYQWLLNVSNELDKDGLRLFCLLVGQEELMKRKNTFITQGLEEIVGRFMTEDWAFPGIDSQENFKKCLMEYDTVVYPIETGRSFAANFIPEAVDFGWKFEKVAEPMWDAFEKMWRGAGLQGNLVIPMHYLNSAVMQLLMLSSKNDRPNLEVDDQTLQTCVERSNIKNAIKALQSKFPRRLPYETRGRPEPAAV